MLRSLFQKLAFAIKPEKASALGKWMSAQKDAVSYQEVRTPPMLGSMAPSYALDEHHPQSLLSHLSREKESFYVLCGYDKRFHKTEQGKTSSSPSRPPCHAPAFSEACSGTSPSSLLPRSGTRTALLVSDCHLLCTRSFNELKKCFLANFGGCFYEVVFIEHRFYL